MPAIEVGGRMAGHHSRICVAIDDANLRRRARRALAGAIALATVGLAARLPAQARRAISVKDNSCAPDCSIATIRVARISGTDAIPLLGFPAQVAGDQRRRIFVMQQRDALPEAPLLVFDSVGKFAGSLGARGTGPGEAGVPNWLVSGWDDSLRLFETPRVIVFDAQLRHAYTRALGTWISRPSQVVPIADGTFAALGSGGLTPGTARPITSMAFSSDDRTTFAQPLVESTAGPLRVLAPVRARRSARLWVAQYAIHDGRGYDLFQVDSRGEVSIALQRRPEWWISGRAQAAIREPITSSRVVAMRELNDGIIAVLAAQPRAEWRTIHIDSRTFAGWWNRYESHLELIDTRQGRLLATARLPGYPRAVVQDDRVVTYIEIDDEPRLDVWRFAK